MALFSNHWVKIFERQYRELTMGEEAENAETAGEVLSAADDEDAASEETDRSRLLSDENEAEEEAAGVSQRGKVVSRMISYISNESL
ncbi:MAG: hypothetical protein J6X94_04970, partial [Lachnospiraceae bacterium]|nr:hypothetical protein [Lachnospiraceae bacterium]